MAASCFSMTTTQVLPSLEAAAPPTSLGGGSACLKARSSRLPMIALPKAAPCHSGMSLARLGISCLAPVLARRRLLRFRALAQDSSLAEQVVEVEHDTPSAQTDEEEEAPPASGLLEGEAGGEQSEEQLGGIQAVQEEEPDVATVPESKAEQESVGDQDYPPLPGGTKIYVGNLPFDVDSEGLAKLFDESGVVEMVEVIYDRSSGRSRGFAFVTMSTVEEAEAAIEKFNGFEIGGRNLRVNFPEVPRLPNGRSPARSPSNSGGFVDSPHKIYVGNLAWSVTSEALREVFNKNGNVLGAKVIQDRETGRSRGFGFVSFSSETEVEAALSEMDGLDVEGRSIRVNVAKPRSTEGQSS